MYLSERIQNCGQPDEPPYSILKITDKPQYSVEYSCSSFYSIQGSSRSVSCVDGQWSGRPPKCKA